MGFLARFKANPYDLFRTLARRGLMKWVPDAPYLKLLYRAHTGRKLNMRHPATFNEKLQWLKVHDRDPDHIRMVDKYAVKEYVAGIIGEEYIIPTIGVWDRFEDIDFGALPDRFVLKCTHDSGGLVICRDKKALDIEAARRKIEKCLKRNYYDISREWPYKYVRPRIIAEKYMEDSLGKGDLTDYKLHFFSGECKAIMVGQNRFGPDGLENDYYTPDWEHYDFTRGHSHNAKERSPRPAELDEMIRVGRRLAKDSPFVRVDLYLIDHRIYFGEITFFPASGYNLFHPDRWDKIYGDWIRLPVDRQRGREPRAGRTEKTVK